MPASLSSPPRAQAALLRVEFEKRNGRKDCLAALVFEFGGRWKKGQISRQLRAMGLERGKFTAAQVGGRLGSLFGRQRGVGGPWGWCV